MKFFKNLLLFIKGLFIKRSLTEKQIISEAKSVLEGALSIEEIYSKINQSDNEVVKSGLLKQIARQEVAEKILRFVENEEISIVRKRKKKKVSRKVYELHELRDELHKLEEQKALLQLKKSKIHHADYPETTSLESRIKILFSLLSKNKINNKVELSNFSVSDFDKDFKQLEKILAEKSTLNKHKTREQENKLYESDIKKELDKLDSLIGQNKLDDAKLRIVKLEKSIKPEYKKGVERFKKAKAKLKEKELEIFKKQQAELLRQQVIEAERIRKEQEAILEQQRIERVQAEEIKRIEEYKKQEEKTKLKVLLNKKANWRDFQKVLQENNITILYHFTDHSNLKSIKENGGLYSWYYCDRNNIEIPMTGNSSLGRKLDRDFGLEDYVRLSFIKDHPMKHVAINEGRISRPVLLKVSIEVCYFENTRFSDMNAADRRHSNSNTVEFLNSLRFDLFHKNYFDLNSIEKKQHQAEILVKTWIPAEYITNLNEIA